ncbi:uncharacterized protein [Apostichopus japonicus]|uniref:uncharacterized protein n=1 Tax=Stichopus japonicus TaxID=307972 RepID=UPI003AB3624B
MISLCKGLIWLLLLILLSLLITGTLVVSGTVKPKVICEPVANSHCACTLDNNEGTFDLQGLVDDTVIPRFSASKGNVTYMYDPCREFSYGDCSDVAACAVSNGVTPETTIAVFNKEMIYDYDDTNGPQLTMRYTNGENPLIKTSVLFFCGKASDEDAVLQVILESPNEYSFSWNSSYICNLPILPEVARISFGTFLCIAVPVVFLCYFSFGFLYLFFIKHESWRNAIPHHEFWCDLPGLIKDGATYTWTSITGKFVGSSNGYQQI